MCRTRMRSGAMGLLCASPLLVEPAISQDRGRGQQLAQNLCANCHFGAHPGEMAGRSGVPTFSSPANSEAQTFDGL